MDCLLPRSSNITNTMTASSLAYLTPDPSADLEGVYHFVLNRPDARNAISRALLQDVLQCLRQLRKMISNPSLTDALPRVLILRANGPAFCAGADLKERGQMSELEVVEFLHNLRQMLDQVEKLPIPTLAAIDGPALGGGLELALACDFRIAAESVDRIGFPEVKLGIIPGAGGTQRAPRIIGVQRAKELIYTGINLNAQQAKQLGLVDYVSPGSSCLELCQQLAQKMIPSAPLALRAAKMAISMGTNVELARGLDLEWACYQPLLETEDRREALDAFQQKRKPVFIGK
ncbi:enoyl-CoA hydratase/isomerase [Pseudozyma hubeiensis SY62]|uniref:Enoyl-CoA hydratase/isomerase n=1 Tax=Pseudozyma hubeiensis (strain SY62) TaxID=1305764 RepID=R9P044_PSEHS|nr:enoyl-CoA hydratase/isomerase [Pseudozyma hubeiensis SY62]GAC94352.1 enoyl-CoA hydratase/isomerase [Pseudozyma hubeiensis SY62]